MNVGGPCRNEEPSAVPGGAADLAERLLRLAEKLEKKFFMESC